MSDNQISKRRRTSAAMAGLLDDITSNLKPINMDNINKSDDNKSVSISQKRELIHSLGEPEKHEKFSVSSGIHYEIKKVKTDLCKPWKMANRLTDYISEESCAELISSIKQVGQQIPALVRKNNESQGYDLICGARRLFACKHLNKDILVAIVDLTDQEALLAMDAENRPREDISPYERALDYKKWVDSGIYRNYVEIGNAIGMNKSWFSKLMTLAELDEAIIKAFRHPSNLLQKWGYELYNICKKDQVAKEKIISLAMSLADQHLKPEIIFKKLKTIGRSNQIPKKNGCEWLITDSNRKIFGLKEDSFGAKQFIFDKTLPDNVVEKIKKYALDLIKSSLDK